MLEEYASDDDDASTMSDSPEGHNIPTAVVKQNIPFSERWYNNQLTYSRETTDSQLSDVTADTPQATQRQLVPRG